MKDTYNERLKKRTALRQLTVAARRRRQAGFSLIDVMMWGGIVLIGLVVIAAGFLAARSKMNSVNETRELPTVISGIQATYNSQSNYAGLTLDTVARGNIWPAQETTVPTSGSATVNDRWGGPVTLTPATINTTNDIARLVYSNVPQTECNNIIQTVASSLRRVYVDNTNSGTAGGGTQVKADGQSLNINMLATACSADQNSVTYDIPH